MKFSDLEFKAHNNALAGTQARATFPNGYGVSVITGPSFYTSAGAPYEVAILFEGLLCYETHLTDDVLGYQTEADVDALLLKVEA